MSDINPKVLRALEEIPVGRTDFEVPDRVVINAVPAAISVVLWCVAVSIFTFLLVVYLGILRTWQFFRDELPARWMWLILTVWCLGVWFVALRLLWLWRH